MAKEDNKGKKRKEPAPPSMDTLDVEHANISKEAVAKYTRGAGTDSKKLKTVSDKKLKTKLKRTEQYAKASAVHAARAEVLLPDAQGSLEAEGMERTWRFRQDQIKEHVDVQTQKKMFNLDLPKYGPYSVDYTRNGKFMLFAGKRGHVALIDWKKSTLQTEFHLPNESIRDVKFLHNETMYAIAQRSHVYVYDKNGIELHHMEKHIEVNKMDFLPYHYLLVTIGKPGYLKYQDVSTGKLVAEHRTRLGPCSVLTQNPWNAVMLCGHSNGTVTMWSPSMSQYLVKMLCHKGALRAAAVDKSGTYMVTSGMDGQVKIWDVRTYKQLHCYYTTTPASTMDISQKGMLAVGYGPHVQIWKDAFQEKQNSPYMTHHMYGETLNNISYVPYEDVLGIGHSNGISSIVVPGSGEPNFDTFEANPYETKKQRQEGEVHKLLEKIQPEMITLDPDYVGQVTRTPHEMIAKERKLAAEAEARLRREEAVNKFKMRGRSGARQRFKKKQNNVIDEKRDKIREAVKGARKNEEDAPVKERTALDRFGGWKK